ncbi:GDSL esterase/lipase 5 [Citrus sinensis]|uniref:GDSL esterase/lipase 5 n=1 Tax=Citrus sinensis TaxID=2711 RepID=A0ACB8J9A4_CITSI|nr:GDSL esterase/lipase 5 [Citrus sinensis]
MARPSSLCSYFFTIVTFLVVVLISTTCEADQSKLPKKKHVASLFIFGDSILDAGNNNYINTTTLDQANFWPYGETFFKYPTGRFSDGRLVSDFMAEYANLPLIPPFLQPGIINRGYYYSGVNFASAGAGALVETFQGDVISLKTQLSYYKKVESWLREKLGNDEGRMRISRGVYLFSIGSNDYYAKVLLTKGFTMLNSFSESNHVGMVIGNLTTVIKEIYKTGGRKFAFMNVPDLGCLPVMRIMNAEKNGFKEGKAACCGTGQFRGVLSCGGKRPVKEFELCENPNEYVYWDSIHLTEMANKQLAREMWNGARNSHVIGPYNLKKLFQIRYANFLPYGEIFFKYPTGRFSDGRINSRFYRVTIDSNIFAIHKPRITHGVNFASSGAGALTETHQGLVIDLKTQLSNFKIVEEQLKKKPGDAAAKTLVSNAVYLIDGGGNDYFVALTTNSSVLQSLYSKKQYVDMVIGNLTTIIKQSTRAVAQSLTTSQRGHRLQPMRVMEPTR